MSDEILTVKGIDQVSAALLDIAERMPVAAAQALNEIAEQVMTRAKEMTPVDTGRLRASGMVSDYATERDMSATLSFGTEYAVPVHENMSAKHQTGSAKYLERPVNEEAGRFLEDMAKGIRDITGLR